MHTVNSVQREPTGQEKQHLYFHWYPSAQNSLKTATASGSLF